MSTPVAKSYHGALIGALISVILLGLIDSVVDFGAEFLILTAMPLFVFWGWAVSVICRRPEAPTGVDLAIIRWGLVPFVLACRFLVVWVYWVAR
jgi:hypothetical protein